MKINKKIKLVFYKSMMAVSWKLSLIKGRVGHRAYPYMYTPKQLLKICSLAEEAIQDSVQQGCIVEAGCAYGATTIFLQKYLEGKFSGQYYAIDTFGGFTEADVAFEKSKRQKRDMSAAFSVNNKEWYEATLILNGVHGVQALPADVGKFDFSGLGGIAFCLMDVDLYQPIARSLPGLYENLLPGGIIVVDDCKPNRIFDGAEQAYREFCNTMNLQPEIHEGKLGILRKRIS